MIWSLQKSGHYREVGLGAIDIIKISALSFSDLNVLKLGELCMCFVRFCSGKTLGRFFIYEISRQKWKIIYPFTVLMNFTRSPSLGLGACNYSMFLSRRFHRPIRSALFSLNLSRIQIPAGTSVTCCFILKEACPCMHVD